MKIIVQCQCHVKKLKKNVSEYKIKPHVIAVTFKMSKKRSITSLTVKHIKNGVSMQNYNLRTGPRVAIFALANTGYGKINFALRAQIKT